MKNPRHLRAWKTLLPAAALPMMLAMSMLASCSSTRQTCNVPLPTVGSSSAEISDETRGTAIELARLGFDHTLQVRRSRNSVPHELHDGDKVASGDRIHALVQTSEDAYLYLAFCAHQTLTIYPSQGGVRIRAGELMVVPQAGAELVLDSDPGTEVLYIILSRIMISIADPHLTQALEAQRPRSVPVDCGPGAGVMRESSSSHDTANPPLKPNPSSAARESATRPGAASPDASPGPVPTGAATPAAPPPDPDFERNPGNIVWYGIDDPTGPGKMGAANDGDIAVVRHVFTHVPQPSPP
jgi:Domain of unknown function (DUF4384)